MHSAKLLFGIIQMCIFLITYECCTKCLFKNVKRLSLEHELVKPGFHSRRGWGWTFLFSLLDRFWGPPNRLYQGYKPMTRGIHCCPNYFYFICPTSVSILCTICVYIHISDCTETVYELPLLPNNTAVKHFYTNRRGAKC